jgi:hypothetical protein
MAFCIISGSAAGSADVHLRLPGPIDNHSVAALRHLAGRGGHLRLMDAPPAVCGVTIRLGVNAVARTEARPLAAQDLPV